MKVVVLMSLICSHLFCPAQDTTSMVASGNVSAQKDAVKEEEGAKKKDSLVNYLEKLDLQDFDKKKTGDFLNAIPSKYKLNIQPSDKKGYLYRTVVMIPDRPYLEIYIYHRGFEYTNPNSFFRKKQHRQVKMERISLINVFNEFMCVNGCDE